MSTDKLASFSDHKLGQCLPNRPRWPDHSCQRKECYPDFGDVFMNRSFCVRMTILHLEISTSGTSHQKMGWKRDAKLSWKMFRFLGETQIGKRCTAENSRIATRNSSLPGINKHGFRDIFGDISNLLGCPVTRSFIPFDSQACFPENATHPFFPDLDH